jgi:predicted nucleotidyltransferase component of viral defense system
LPKLELIDPEAARRGYQDRSGNLLNGSNQRMSVSVVACPVRRARRRFPVGASPTRQPLQPEATGAGMEVTKCPWFSGETKIATFSNEELLSTKIRALLQRNKGRDLIDLSHALDVFPDFDTQISTRWYRT